MATAESRAERFAITAGAVVVVGAGAYGLYRVLHKPPPTTVAPPVTPPSTVPTTWRGVPITRPGGTLWLELTGSAPTTAVVWVAEYQNGVFVRAYPQKGWPHTQPWTGGVPTSPGALSPVTPPTTLPTAWRGVAITRPLGTVWLELTGNYPAPRTSVVWVAEYTNGALVKVYPQKGWPGSQPWSGGYAHPKTPTRGGHSTGGTRSTGAASSTSGTPSTGTGGTGTGLPSYPATLPSTWRGEAITRPLGTVWLELTGAAPTTAVVWVAEYHNGAFVKLYPQQGWPASQYWTGGYAAGTGSPATGSTGSGSASGTRSAAPSAPSALPSTWRGYPITRPLGTVWLELTGTFPSSTTVWVAEYQHGAWVRTYPQQGWRDSVPWTGGYAA